MPRTLIEVEVREDNLVGVRDLVEVVLEGCCEELLLATDKSEVGSKRQLDRLRDHFRQLGRDDTQHGTFHYRIRAG